MVWIDRWKERIYTNGSVDVLISGRLREEWSDDCRIASCIIASCYQTDDISSVVQTRDLDLANGSVILGISIINVL